MRLSEGPRECSQIEKMGVRGTGSFAGLPANASTIDSLCRILDLAAEAVVLSNARGEIVMVNARTESLFGYERKELLGQKIEMLMPERYRHAHETKREVFSDEGRARRMGGGLELIALCKDGTEIPVEISIGPIDDHGLHFSMIVDLSERKKMQEDLEKARLQLISADRLTALGVMAAGVAHEISNPLAIIHACASNLLEMAEHDKVQESAVRKECSRIVHTAQRITKIIASMRLIAREGSRDSLRETPVSQIFAQTFELCQQRFRAHGVCLVVPALDDGIRIFCREVQVAQVLLNLLQNAFDAVAARTGEKWIELEVETSAREVSIHVIDSGPGVPDELISKIMDPFFTTKPVGQGTGLGLSISKSIAEQHGGTLAVGQRKGHTCFSLILPVPPKEAVSLCS